MTTTSKRKRVVLTLEDKLEVIRMREEGMSIDRIAQQFNIGGSTVSEIYKRRTDIECAVKRNKTTGKNRKTMKEGSKPAVESLLFEWWHEQKHNPSSREPTTQEVIERAKFIHSQTQEIDDEDFNEWNPTKGLLISGWVIRFKERYGIKSEKSTEEQKTPWHTALEAAEFLLDYINNREDFQLKDVITVRMIRDRIASEQDCLSSE